MQRGRGSSAGRVAPRCALVPLVPAFILGSALILASCGERVVHAHDASGTRSEAHEVRGEDGVWRRDGPFRAWHSSGELAEEGAFRDGLQEGAWTTWHVGGAPHARGSYLFGAKEGVWIERRPDGSLDEAASGIFESGERTGDLLVDGVQTDWFAPDEPRERASWVDGLRHGVATTWYPGGAKRSEGTYERGRRTGHWTYWREDGSLDERLSGTYDGWRRIGE